jgi:hypothetical protein
MADIRIEGRGFYSIHGDTEAGRDWMETHVNDYLPLEGVAYCESSNYALDIADGAADDGLTIEVNGRIYHAA